MKKIIFLSVSCALISLTSVAQNTFPTSGNVGIGTTNPTGARLDVLTNSGETESLARFKIYDAPNDYLQIANGTGNVNQFIPLIKGHHQSDNRTTITIMGSSTDVMDIGTNALVNFNARRKNSQIINRPLFVWTNYDQKMMTMAANGNVGIGTTTPDQALVVQGNIAFDYGDTKSYNGFRREGVKTEYYNIITGGTAVIHEFTGSNGAIMSLKNDGKIGIGTTTPDSKLAVNGKIHAKEVKVDLTGWPDYVFEDNYNLPSLQEVENHIIEKGHLSNIPSAKEVEKEGIQLGEMNAKFLQKIEELTLYMIAQNKKIEKLQKEVEELKK